MRFPLHIELRPSRLLQAALMLGHLLAMASLLGLPWPFYWRVFLALSVAFSLVFNLRRRPGVAALKLVSPEQLLFQSGGVWRSSRIEPDSALLGPLLSLRLQDEEERQVHTLVLLPDSMGASEMRALRVWLRWRRPVGAAERGADAPHA